MPGLSVSVCMTVNSSEPDGPSLGVPFHFAPENPAGYGIWLSAGEVKDLYEILSTDESARRYPALCFKIRQLVPVVQDPGAAPVCNCQARQ